MGRRTAGVTGCQHQELRVGSSLTAPGDGKTRCCDALTLVSPTLIILVRIPAGCGSRASLCDARGPFGLNNLRVMWSGISWYLPTLVILPSHYVCVGREGCDSSPLLLLHAVALSPRVRLGTWRRWMHIVDKLCETAMRCWVCSGFRVSGLQ